MLGIIAADSEVGIVDVIDKGQQDGELADVRVLAP